MRIKQRQGSAKETHPRGGLRRQLVEALQNAQSIPCEAIRLDRSLDCDETGARQERQLR